MGAALHTYEDLLAIPDDSLRRELFDGVLVVTPPPPPPHQMVAVRTLYALFDWARPIGWTVIPGPIGLYQDQRNYVEPDVIVLAPDHPEDVEGDAMYLAHPPVVVVEISSPSTRRRDLTVKAEWYRRFGVPEYWFVDRRRRMVVAHRLRDGRYEVENLIGGAALTSHLLPGFSVAVAALFPTGQ
jgi:Uma2 family endonuclease